MERKCIYCGATADLSESDIIPDALTNARILNKNVCRIAHNNRFSDLFESKVISALAFITNELDIKSSKGKRYATYDATVTIEGEAYDISMQSNKAIFDGRVLKSADKTHILSSYETIVKIAKDESLVQKIDINQIEVEKNVKIDTGIFFDPAMFRMVAKIAYEWYCAKNGVDGFHPEFSSIVSYITDGIGNCPVSIIQTAEMYKMISTQLNLGSHALFAFESTDGKINVVISLFGILMYRVIVADAKPAFCSNNFLFIELCTDSSRREITHKSLDEAKKRFDKIFNPQNLITVSNINGVSIMIPGLFPQTSNLLLYMFVFDMIKCFEGIQDDTTIPNETIMQILFNQLQQITQESLLHKKSIKRFVNEYFSEGHDPIQLNPSTSNKKETILFYTVFLVGKSEIKMLDDEAFQRLLRENLPLSIGAVVSVTDELETKLKSEMLDTVGYSEILEAGARIIKNWTN